MNSQPNPLTQSMNNQKENTTWQINNCSTSGIVITMKRVKVLGEREFWEFLKLFNVQINH